MAHYARGRAHDPTRPRCEIAGCSDPIYARGLCSKHWQRQRRNGDPLVVVRQERGVVQRFIKEVALPYRGTECLIWPFSKRGTTGYAQMLVNGKNITVSRFVCETVWGPPPTPDHEAAHSCGRGGDGCIAATHLRWLLHIENMQEAIAHGTSLRGRRHPNCVLDEQKVRTIRAIGDQLPQAEIAGIFGIARTTVNAILHRYTWAWLE
jgi:hypothetical protein